MLLLLLLLFGDRYPPFQPNPPLPIPSNNNTTVQWDLYLAPSGAPHRYIASPLSTRLCDSRSRCCDTRRPIRHGNHGGVTHIHGPCPLIPSAARHTTSTKSTISSGMPISDHCDHPPDINRPCSPQAIQLALDASSATPNTI